MNVLTQALGTTSATPVVSATAEHGPTINPQGFAKQIADLIGANENFVSLANGQDTARNTLQRGPFYLMLVVEGIVGADNMARLPWPGTDKDSPVVKSGNGAVLPDNFEGMVSNGKGGQKKGTLSTLNMIADLTPKGQKHVTTIAQWQAATNGNAAAPEHMRNMLPYQQEEKLAAEQGYQRNFRKLMKDVAKLHHNIQAIRGLAGITLSYDTVKTAAGGDDVADTNTPIIIVDASDLPGGSGVRAKKFSAREVIGFDVARAVSEAAAGKHPNLWTSLVYSGARVDGTNGDDATGGKKLDMNMVESQLAGIGHYMEATGGIIETCKRARTSPSFLLTLRAINVELTAILQKQEFRHMLADLDAKLAAQEKAERDAVAA